MDQLVPGTDIEKELYQGDPIQFIFLDCVEAGAGTDLLFTIEINGVQVFKGRLSDLNAENGLKNGFISNFTAGENLSCGFLDLRNGSLNNIGGNIHSVTWKFIDDSAFTEFNKLDITVGELINVD